MTEERQRHYNQGDDDEAKCVSLSGFAVREPNEPVPPLVAMLETMLDDARSGHLQGAAVACVYENGFSKSDWHGSYHALGPRMMGAIAYLFRGYSG